MAEAKLEIQIDVDGVPRSVRQLRSVDSAIKSIDSRTTGLASTARGAGNTVQNAVNKWKKSFDQFDKMIKMVGTIGLKGLTMSLKFATIEMVAMGAAMLAIHGAFVLGNAAMKAMKATLGPLAAGMTTVVAGIAAVSAAIREQQAAMWAYKNNSAPEFGSGLNQARMVMRALHTDVELSTVGIENLNKAYATVSKSSTFTSGSQQLLKGLMDFASAGQPIEEGITKAGELIALLQDSKKSFSEAKSSAEQLFPDKKAVQKAMKDLKISTKEGLQKAITSGELAKAAGVEGQFDAVSGTLMNRVKGYFNILRNQLGDLGQPLLEPIKQASNQIFNILRRGFISISGNTQKFGMGSMLEGLVSMVDKLTTWSTNLINENISSVDGMFEKMAGWWKDFRYGWNEVLDKLRPFIDGARVIEKAFAETWRHVKDIVGSGFGQFNEWLQANEETVIEFGGKVGDLFTSIAKFQMEIKKIIQDLMPFINNVIGGISQMVDQMTGFIKALRSITGGGVVGALASLLAIRTGLGAMKNAKGGFTVSQKLTNQPINAQNVTITTPRPVTGGGSLGTTGAAMGGTAPGGGLASRTGGPRGLASYPALPGGLASRGGTSAGPYSYIGPYIGQPGYSGPTPIPPIGGPMMQGAIGGINRYRQWSYNTMFAPGMSDDERRDARMNRQNAAGTGYSFRARMAQRAAAQRAARSGPNQSTGMRRFNNFQGSGGARMGTGLALGAMSQFAPAEAQGALALGGMVGTMNPLAGLAVAGLGTAMKAETTTGGVLTGAAGGAALGALVGSAIPVVGTAAGAAAGALIGAVSGGIMGSINRNKKQVKEAKTAASNATQSIVNGVLSGVLDATREESGGKGTTSLRKALPAIRGRQQAVLDIINQAPGKLSGGFSGRFMRNAGLRGNTITKGIEDITGKEIPGLLKGVIGVTTSSISNVLNIAGTTVSKLGLKRFVNNRTLNPLGFGATNRDDFRTQQQKGTLQNIYARQASLGMTISEEDFEKMMKKPGDALEKMRKDMENNEKAMGPMQETYNKRMDALGKITGKTDIEINDMAKSMGVNLMDNTKEFTKILEELGLATAKTAEQMNAATTQIYTNMLKNFDTVLESKRAPEILDERAKAFALAARQKGGTASETEMIEFTRDQMAGLLTFFKGNAGLALAESLRTFGPGGTALRGPMAGLNVDFGGNQAIQDALNQSKSDYGLAAGQQINAMLGNNMVNAQEVQKRVQGMTADQIANLSGVLEYGIGTGQDAQMAIRQYGSRDKAILAAAGFGDLAMETKLAAGTEATDLTNVSTEIATSTKKLIEQMEIYFKDANEAVPSWYNTPPTWWNKDTSTPRGQAFGDTTSSRLSQTMGRHAQMNGMLTGTRTVTSAFRTYGLGSMNSDHVTGRAYDLVGQNLGQYQSLVRSTGGFAEFHGVNGARHLHVVPGSGPIGDSRVPVSMATSPASVVMSGGGGGSNYNFYITGSQNASAKEIAEMVMQKVKEAERSHRERR